MKRLTLFGFLLLGQTANAVAAVRMRWAILVGVILAFQTDRACIQRRFRLELSATGGGVMLTLSANELATDGAGSHFTAVGSH
ncbi:hypothetical protein [Massilia scottii]|uniref:hypothetical protein n=1 Tax=Massilia scottii TaxID=3057166 RepID=UPI002796686A|nr:hypothetical protein [Massilia sp. CCM 9029]MDQ1835069.1 hypothetical protein [Massilia sp. CCM 9029]